MRWHVYIIECENKTLYTGITNDLKKRFLMHKTGKGARYTRFNKPIKIVYSRRYQNRSIAQKREIEIKKWTRPMKLALIKASRGGKNVRKSNNSSIQR